MVDQIIAPLVERIEELKERINDTIEELQSQIDGGEECRGRDSQISHVINILEGTIK